MTCTHCKTPIGNAESFQLDNPKRVFCKACFYALYAR